MVDKFKKKKGLKEILKDIVDKKLLKDMVSENL